MSDSFNKLRNLAQLFCSRAGVVSDDPEYVKIKISDDRSGADIRSFIASMRFLREASRQGFIKNFTDVSERSDVISLYGRELRVATGVFARGDNDGCSVVVSLPRDIACRIEDKVSFDFDPLDN